LGAAAVLFGIAWHFGGQSPYKTASPSRETPETQYAIAPNNTAGLAALGFALGGGLALVAAALVRPDPAERGAA
jgi:hypothetical protein